MKDKFYGRPITEDSIQEYLDAVYGLDNITLGIDVDIADCKGFLQKDYGNDNDCTLTSIAAMFQGVGSSLFETMEKTYSTIWKIASSLRAYSEKRGTNPLRVKRIVEQYIDEIPHWWYLCNAIAGENNPICKSRYFKNFFYSFKTIKRSIDRGYPVVLSIHRDGRGYYNDHTVLVGGYAFHHHKDKKSPLIFLKVFDNWSTKWRYIDYQKLGCISSIYYLEEKF